MLTGCNDNKNLRKVRYKIYKRNKSLKKIHAFHLKGRFTLFYLWLYDADL